MISCRSKARESGLVTRKTVRVEGWANPVARLPIKAVICARLSMKKRSIGRVSGGALMRKRA
jgi:hypothetical protein